MDPHRSHMPGEERVTKRYYIDGGLTPICAWYDERGIARAAQIPGARSRELAHDATWLIWLECSAELEEVDEAAFDAACQRYWTARRL